MTVRQEQPRLSRSAWRVLRNRNFGVFFTGSLASNLGTWLQNTAQVLLAYQFTRSVFAVGMVTCAQFSGSLFLGPWAAVIACRLGGKRLLVAIQALSAVMAAAMAALQAAGLLTEPILIVGALGLGLAFTFALPVQTALAPQLVKSSDTEAAMAMNSVSYNAGRALAPALCVLLIHTTGFAWAFGLNAVSFLVFAFALGKACPRAVPVPARQPRARDGISIAVQVPRIALLLAMVAAVTFADDPILILGPALARHLGAPTDWVGYFLSALGCGTVLGSLWPTRDPEAWRPSRTARWAAGPLVALVVCVAIFIAGLSEWISLAAAFLAGAAAFRTSAVTQTQLVRERPANAASVMALWAIAWAGTKPLASLTDGWVANSHGLAWAVAVVAGPALALGLMELCLPGQWKARIKGWITKSGTRLLNPSRPADQAARRLVGGQLPDSPRPDLPLVAPAPLPPPGRR
jgi:predicted MFS family arabinose efflux permease